MGSLFFLFAMPFRSGCERSRAKSLAHRDFGAVCESKQKTKSPSQPLHLKTFFLRRALHSSEVFGGICWLTKVARVCGPLNFVCVCLIVARSLFLEVPFSGVLRLT